jgi:hypothetical protein
MIEGRVVEGWSAAVPEFGTPRREASRRVDHGTAMWHTARHFAHHDTRHSMWHAAWGYVCAPTEMGFGSTSKASGGPRECDPQARADDDGVCQYEKSTLFVADH